MASISKKPASVSFLLTKVCHPASSSCEKAKAVIADTHLAVIRHTTVSGIQTEINVGHVVVRATDRPRPIIPLDPPNGISFHRSSTTHLVLTVDVGDMGHHCRHRSAKIKEDNRLGRMYPRSILLVPLLQRVSCSRLRLTT